MNLVPIQQSDCNLVRIPTYTPQVNTISIGLLLVLEEKIISRHGYRIHRPFE